MFVKYNIKVIRNQEMQRSYYKSIFIYNFFYNKWTKSKENYINTLSIISIYFSKEIKLLLYIKCERKT